MFNGDCCHIKATKEGGEREKGMKKDGEEEEEEVEEEKKGEGGKGEKEEKRRKKWGRGKRSGRAQIVYPQPLNKW